MTDLRRVEIAIAGDAVTGAQITTTDGRTQGVNTGTNPEYAAVLADVLGETLAAALVAIAERDARIAELEAGIDA